MSETRAPYYLELEQIPTVIEGRTPTISDLQHRIVELEANNRLLLQMVELWKTRFGGTRVTCRQLREQRDSAMSQTEICAAMLHRLTEKCADKDGEIGYWQGWNEHLQHELEAADWWAQAWKTKAKKYRSAYFTNCGILTDYRNLFGSVRRRLAYLHGEAPRIAVHKVQERIGEILETLK